MKEQRKEKMKKMKQVKRKADLPDNVASCMVARAVLADSTL